jgi:hypothetical protein
MNREIRRASTTDVEAVAELRAVVLRADLERLGRYDEQRVRQLRDSSGSTADTATSSGVA